MIAYYIQENDNSTLETHFRVFHVAESTFFILAYSTLFTSILCLPLVDLLAQFGRLGCHFLGRPVVAVGVRN